MKNISLIFALLHIGSLVLAQSSVVELSEDKLLGYVFVKEYQPSFKMDFVDDRFTPTMEEVKLAEELLESFDLKSRKSKKAKRRQYLGYITRNTKYILIHTMYYKCDKQFSKDYQNWDETFAYLFSEPDEMQKSNLYIVNLSDKTIGPFGGF